jgi:hypothetical protein
VRLRLALVVLLVMRVVVLLRRRALEEGGVGPTDAGERAEAVEHGAARHVRGRRW